MERRTLYSNSGEFWKEQAMLIMALANSSEQKCYGDTGNYICDQASKKIYEYN